MNIERRTSRREIVPSLVYLDLQPNNGGILLNLNARGMQISVALPLAATKSVRFSFGLDSSTKIEGTGRIAWIGQSGKTAGISFVDLPESALGLITQWLKAASSTAAVLEPDDIDCTSTQAAEPQSEVPCPSPAPYTPEVPQPAEPEMAAAACTAVETEEYWDPPAEAETAPAVAEELCPSPEPYIPEIPQSAEPEMAAAACTTVETEECWDPPAEAETAPAVAEELCPSPEPYIPEIPQSAEPEMAAAACTTVETEECWDPPAEAETAPAVTKEPSPWSTDSWQPEFEWNRETTRVEPETPTTPPGLNDPLPVFTMPASAPAPASTPYLASQVIFAEMRKLGWGFERDWHVGLGMLLLAFSFLALWERPPLVMLAIALWVASAFLLMNRKQPPKDAANSMPVGGQR